jgi:glutaredoxin-like protein
MTSAELDAKAAEREIVVYTRPGCPYCFALRAGLRRSGLAYREVDIWKDPDGAAFVRSVANGNETVPTVVVGDVHMVNPSVRRVRSVATQANVPRSERRRWLGRGRGSGESA